MTHSRGQWRRRLPLRRVGRRSDRPPLAQKIALEFFEADAIKVANVSLPWELTDRQEYRRPPPPMCQVTPVTPIERIASAVGIPCDVRTSTCRNFADRTRRVHLDILYLHHAGFENNDGGHGELVIDVAAGTVDLSHYDRFVDSVFSGTEI